MTRKSLELSVLLAIASSVIFTIYPALATTYTPGVKAGDYVTYGTVSASFTSNVSSTPTPQFIKDFQATSSFRLDVISVSGTNVTEKVTQSFSNGTADRIQFVNWDVQTLSGNATGGNGFNFGSLPLLAAAGLTTSDKLCTGSNCGSVQNASFNSTQSRTYAGASRNDNVLTISPSFGPGSTSTITGYWDQATGALMEISFSISSNIPAFGGSPAQHNTYSIHVADTATSLWSANILGLSPIVFYGIIVAIVVVIAIIAAVMIMKMRKPKVPAMPSPAGTTTSSPGS